MIARVIITRKCNRKCDGCCNNYPSLMSQIQPITNIWELNRKDVSEILITGGEPLLFPKEVSRLVTEIKGFERKPK